MTDAARLAAEVDTFAQIVDDLRAIASRNDPARRSELIALRRKMSERIVLVRECGLRAFVDPALANDFRSRLSHAANLMALHQAKWPAISIGDDETAYRRSSQQLAEANRAFIDWTRAALTKIR